MSMSVYVGAEWRGGAVISFLLVVWLKEIKKKKKKGFYLDFEMPMLVVCL